MSMTGNTLIAVDKMSHMVTHAAFIAKAMNSLFAIPNGHFTCPVCSQGRVYWSAAPDRHVTLLCSTPGCMSATQ